MRIPKSSISLLIPNCTSPPMPLWVELKLAGAESTELATSEGDLLTLCDPLKKKCDNAKIHRVAYFLLCIQSIYLIKWATSVRVHCCPCSMTSYTLVSSYVTRQCTACTASRGHWKWLHI